MPPPRLQRAHAVGAIDHLDTLTLLGADGVARTLSGDSAALGRAVMGYLVAPHTLEQVRAHVAALAGTPVTPGGVVDELVALLRAAGAVLAIPASASPPAGTPAVRPQTAGEPAAAATSSRRRPRVVLGLTGAVQTALAPELVLRLLDRGYEVRVATTANALRFVTTTALEALTHEPVYSQLYRRAPREPAPHIQLAEWADAVLICPATARVIARLAHGETADVVSGLAIATRAPVLVVPSMNVGMYTAPAVQRNLAQLRDDGFYVAHAAHGHEVALRPSERAPMYGSAPPNELVVRLLAMVLAARGGSGAAAGGATAGAAAGGAGGAGGAAAGSGSGSGSGAAGGAGRAGAAGGAGAGRGARYVPQTAHEWDEIYATAPLASLPWFAEAPDADVLAALDAVAPRGGTLLDVGTGPGTLAIAAAQRGLSVTAMDLSARALEQARARAGALPIAFVRDDVLDPHVGTRFDVVLDRGCLHVLPAARHAAYAASVARLVAPGGALLLKVHSADEPGEHGTTRFAPEQLAALFAPHFALERAEPSTLPGPRGAPRALLCVLRRRGE